MLEVVMLMTQMLVVPDAGIDTSGPDTDASDPDTIICLGGIVGAHGSAAHDAGINPSDRGRDAYRDTYRANPYMIWNNLVIEIVPGE